MTTRRHVEEDEAPVETPRVDRTAQARAAANRIRARVASVVWIACAVAALILAGGALCIALKANPDNSLVNFLIDTADKLDFGVFSRTEGVAHWAGDSQAALTKNACVNWGLAAVLWLIIGKVLEQIIRPKSA